MNRELIDKVDQRRIHEFIDKFHLLSADNTKKSSVSVLTLPLPLIPVLLDGHVPLPLQVDDLVVVDEPGLDHVLAVRHHALGRRPGRAHKLLRLRPGPVAPHHEGRVVHCRGGGSEAWAMAYFSVPLQL